MTYFFIIFLILALFGLVYKFPFIHSLPVLMYHSVSKNKNEDLTVLQSELEKQFQFLKENNYQTIFYDEIDKSKKQVLLTFDDGYVNNLNLLVPLLIQFNFKATIFLPFEFIGKKDEWWTNSEEIMSIETLKKLDAQYVQLGWHSYSHKSYKTMSIIDIKNDLIKSKNFIESNNLSVAPILAYPFGNFPKNKAKQIQLFSLFEEFGFEYAFRIGNRLNVYPFKNKYLIKRIDIRGTDKIIAFRWKMKFGRIKPF
jgi:peptidoglycan/xylan/chitin deacetylase (PgdA/CDA1 family)